MHDEGLIMRIDNQVAIITGAASGMGAATAIALAKSGAKIALLDKQVDKVIKLAHELKGIGLECDVTNAIGAEHAFNQIVEELGPPRICVNCAGICSGKLIVGNESTPMPLEEFISTIQVNLIGSFNIMRLAAAVMSKATPKGEDAECGIIINTASIAAFEGQIGQIAYSASKGGIVSMTLPAARELARYGIRVVAIAPGLVDTPMLKSLPEKVKVHLLEDIPFPKRFGKVAEYANLVMHIIANPLINGTVIRLYCSL